MSVCLSPSRSAAHAACRRRYAHVTSLVPPVAAYVYVYVAPRMHALAAERAHTPRRAHSRDPTPSRPCARGRTRVLDAVISRHYVPETRSHWLPPLHLPRLQRISRLSFPVPRLRRPEHELSQRSVRVQRCLPLRDPSPPRQRASETDLKNSPAVTGHARLLRPFTVRSVRSHLRRTRPGRVRVASSSSRRLTAVSWARRIVHSPRALATRPASRVLSSRIPRARFSSPFSASVFLLLLPAASRLVKHPGYLPTARRTVTSGDVLRASLALGRPCLPDRGYRQRPTAVALVPVLHLVRYAQLYV
ncbi:hypothetical protein C8Q79DRAFT_14804 [Trametes meyenii]|nr:hypothetical protein C8Q79DRAFT_14804 [Trametes meyenii]